MNRLDAGIVLFSLVTGACAIWGPIILVVMIGTRIAQYRRAGTIIWVILSCHCVADRLAG